MTTDNVASTPSIVTETASAPRTIRRDQPVNDRPRRFGIDDRPRTIVVNGVEQFGTFDEIVRRFELDSREITSEVRFRQFYRSEKDRRQRKAQKNRKRRQ